MCLQTYTGNILIAVNPFRKLPHLYDSHMMAQYKGAAFGELSPHPFAVADTSYRYFIASNWELFLVFLLVCLTIKNSIGLDAD